MLRQKNPPTVFHDDNSVFTDFSQEALDYSRDGFAAVLSSTEDYLYFGRFKPFNAVYVELTTANTNANDLTIEFSEESTFTAVSNLVDETKGLTRSGFIRWDRALDMKAQTVNSESKFWIRIRPGADFSAGTEIKGMNIVFSDDQDLKAEYPEILSLISSNETTYILRHQAARDDIIQNLRNRGHLKRLSATPQSQDDLITESRRENIEPWDLLDSEEINRWSVFKTLHKIFSNLQSGEDDFYQQKAAEFKRKAKEAGDLYYISIDTNDDGFAGAGEKLQEIGSVFIARR